MTGMEAREGSWRFECWPRSRSRERSRSTVGPVWVRTLPDGGAGSGEVSVEVEPSAGEWGHPIPVKEPEALARNPPLQMEMAAEAVINTMGMLAVQGEVMGPTERMGRKTATSIRLGLWAACRE